MSTYPSETGGKHIVQVKYSMSLQAEVYLCCHSVIHDE